MKIKLKNDPGTYYTALYCVKNGKLFAAYGDEAYYAPAFPVTKESDKMYPFISTVRSREFVDDVLNSMIVHHSDPNQKFSIVLRGKESVVSSNGTIIFAAGSSFEALHFATKQIYENLDQFKKSHFTGYNEELKMRPKSIVYS